VNNSRLFILFLRILANLAKSIDIKEKTLYNRWAWNVALKLNVATLLEWRELQWSMSWQRPGGKFYIKIALIPELTCIFWV